jgi:hypothetical protein
MGLVSGSYSYALIALCPNQHSSNVVDTIKKDTGATQVRGCTGEFLVPQKKELAVPLPQLIGVETRAREPPPTGCDPRWITFLRKCNV